VLLENLKKRIDPLIQGKTAFLRPPEHIHADLALNSPLALAKLLGKKPADVAGELSKKIGSWPEIAQVEITPPGFLNLRLKSEALWENLQTLVAHPQDYGRLSSPPTEKWMVEYVSANPTGPLHVGHGRGAALGDSMSRILKHLGCCVHREYYVNDVGRQVQKLGESLAYRWGELHGRPADQKPKEWNEWPKAFPEDGYQGLYVTASAEGISGPFSNLLDYTQYGIQDFQVKIRKDLEDFGVTFDKWFFESELHKQGKIAEVLEELKKRGKAYEKDGTLWFGTDKSEDDKERVLVRADGRPTYFASDIAYHKDKFERGFNKLVNIWGADHHGYVARVKAGLAALDLPAQNFSVVLNQMVQLTRNGVPVKMSKRAGEIITLREVLDEAGKDACRFFFAMRSPNSQLQFDLELAKKQSQENPVYYVQYVHARIASIFREMEKKTSAEAQGLKKATAASLMHPGPRSTAKGAAATPDLQPEERQVLLHLAWFPETLLACLQEFSPHPLTSYLTELARFFHAFYEKHRVLTDDPALMRSRLALCRGIQQTIRTGLELLGVSAPDRM